MNDEELRGLEERVQLIKDMASHPGWEIALDRARASMYMRQKQIILGKAKSYEEYKEWVAWMDGLQHFMNMPEMVQKELDTELSNREEQ